MLVGIRTIPVPIILNYGGEKHTELGEAKNLYMFATLLFIPILPIRYKGPVYDNGHNMYRREIPTWGYALNFCFSIVGIFGVLSVA